MKSDFLRSVDHYENFPVASFLLPKSIRKPIIDVYNFARLADDIADEGNNSSEERLRLLKIFENVLKNENISSNFNTLIEKNIFFTSRKLKESLRLTLQNRPELLKKKELSDLEIELLNEIKDE